MASHAHPTTTAIQIPNTGELFGIAMPPKNPATMTSPDTSDRRDSDRSPRRDRARAAKKQLTAREMNPRPPATKCSMPNVLIDVGGPLGVPTGNPSIGSARNTAAAIMLAPKMPRNTLVARDVGPIARRIPTAAATTSRPVTTKFAVWTHPPGPFASTLSGCLAKAKPARTNA